MTQPIGLPPPAPIALKDRAEVFVGDYYSRTREEIRAQVMAYIEQGDAVVVW